MSATAATLFPRVVRVDVGLKLTVNEEKTRICRVPEGSFDFLGYTFGRDAGAGLIHSRTCTDTLVSCA